ncbi:MAG: hypothetical protein JO353_07095, partial [Phycisphaerae bacterium]|nr:hypothetical protein [Phycisphaerae bacterium]
MTDEPKPTSSFIVPTSSFSPFRRWARRIIKLALIVYLVICLLVFLFQNWLIYPGRSSQGQQW